MSAHHPKCCYTPRQANTPRVGDSVRRLSRGLLIAVSILNGAAGLICGVLFLAAPDGSLMQAGELLPIIRELPLAHIFFQDFAWIGVAMLLVLAIPNSVAAVALFRRTERQYLLTLIAGVLLMLWCGFELIFMINGLAIGYFVVGLISVLCSAYLLRSDTT